MPKNSFLASLLKWKILPPMRTPTTFCQNNQHIHWTAKCMAYFAADSMVRLYTKTHFPEKVNFLDHLGQGNLPCHLSSSLPFRHFSRPTNIPTHYT